MPIAILPRFSTASTDASISLPSWPACCAPPPLHHHVQPPSFGWLRFVANQEYLCVRCGANVNALDQDGDTPLDCALASNAVGVADYLRSHGAITRADLNAQVSGGVQVVENNKVESVDSTKWKQASTPTLDFVGSTAGEVAIDSSKNVTAELTQRIESLEASLREVLLKLETLEARQIVSSTSDNSQGDRENFAQTLPEILAWLATQDRVSLAVLRDHLLPLDLLPSAVIDEINERALDLTGETAFEENGEDFISVAREILAQVLGNKTPTSNQELIPN